MAIVLRSGNTFSFNDFVSPDWEDENIDGKFIELMQLSDRIPLLSTVTNLFLLLIKCSFSLERTDASDMEHILFHTVEKYVTERSPIRFVCLLIPVLGNIVVAIMDFAFEYFDDLHYQAKKKIAMEKLETRECKLSNLDPKIRNDIDVVKQAVDLDGLEIRNAREALRANNYIARRAVRNNGLALQYIAENLRKDREFVLTAVRQNGLALQFAKDLTGDDLFVVTQAAVLQCKEALELVSEELKTDPCFSDWLQTLSS